MSSPAAAPSPFQQNVNIMSSYALQSFAESTTTSTIAFYCGFLDPITASIYCLTRFAIGAPLSYACDFVFEGPGANTASKTTSFILKNILPLLVAFGTCFLSGFSIPIVTVGYLGAITLGVAGASILAQKITHIVELGLIEYFR